MKVQDDDGLKLVHEIEAKRGGKMGWRTFSTWYADTEGNIRERGVFLYEIDKVFWYEDFEAHPQIFGFEIKPKAGASPYVKYENKFTASDVKEMFIVNKKNAKSFAEGFTKKLPKANILQKMFTQVVSAVIFNDGSVKFFEVFGKDFENKIKEFKKEK